ASPLLSSSVETCSYENQLLSGRSDKRHYAFSFGTKRLFAMSAGFRFAYPKFGKIPSGIEKGYSTNRIPSL
ncbi:MAG: hypothetical protein LBQ01_06620, partial [Prevotellaceae bacterium]|nr:hypothetical protein [Prevotellaceae bacterium]